MKIYLRKKVNANGKTSLFLEYYSGYSKDSKGRIKHKRKYQFLDIQIHTEPKNQKQRNENKELLEVANNILKKKQIEGLNSDFEITPDDKLKMNFIEYFQNSIDKRNYKDSTLKAFEITLKHLIDYCNPDTTTFKNIDENFVTGFMSYLDKLVIFDNQKLKNNSKRLYFNAFKTIILQAYRSGIFKKNPLLNIKGYSLQDTEKIYLTLEEIQKLNDTECKKPLLKRAFLFSCFTGLRFSDIYNLKWNQLNKDSGNIKIAFKMRKTGRQEYLTLSKQALKYLGNKGNPESRIFEGLKYDMTVNKGLIKWVLKAGINKEITFHSARHSFATMLLTSGVDLYTVSKMLGHSKIETTQIYAKIINQKMIEAVNKIPELK